MRLADVERDRKRRAFERAEGERLDRNRRVLHPGATLTELIVKAKWKSEYEAKVVECESKLDSR
jgi:hypothetical protein